MKSNRDLLYLYAVNVGVGASGKYLAISADESILETE
jgi:hypothetical protein